ncbi:hypothetical protein V8D89_011253 [Ganoderma adspersum]
MSPLVHRTSPSRPFSLIKWDIGCIHHANCRATADTTLFSICAHSACLAHPVTLDGSHRAAFVHAREYPSPSGTEAEEHSKTLAWVGTGQELRIPDTFDALPTPSWPQHDAGQEKGRLELGQRTSGSRRPTPTILQITPRRLSTHGPRPVVVRLFGVSSYARHQSRHSRKLYAIRPPAARRQVRPWWLNSAIPTPRPPDCVSESILHRITSHVASELHKGRRIYPRCTGHTTDGEPLWFIDRRSS